MFDPDLAQQEELSPDLQVIHQKYIALVQGFINEFIDNIGTTKQEFDKLVKSGSVNSAYKEDLDVVRNLNNYQIFKVTMSIHCLNKRQMI